MVAATYIAAKWQRPRRDEIRIVVVHCTISPEQGSGAEAVARYFQNVDRPASTQLVADNNSVVRCVPDNMECAGAAGANRDGLHIELVGYADQSREQWLDAYGQAMFRQAGPFMREWSRLYNIPPRWLTVAEVAGGKARGFCTHADVSAAFPAVSTGHYDPGKQFPKQAVMDLWFPPAPIPTMEDDMALIIRGNDAGRPARLIAGPLASLISKADREELERKGVVSVVVDDATYDAAKKQLDDLFH